MGIQNPNSCDVAGEWISCALIYSDMQHIMAAEAVCYNKPSFRSHILGKQPIPGDSHTTFSLIAKYLRN